MLSQQLSTPIVGAVLTDGARLYVQEYANGRFIAVQVAATGGNTVPIPTPFPNIALDNISPDKSELVFGSFTGSEWDQPVWALPILGGSPRRLADLTGQDANWMPNGDLLISHGWQFRKWCRCWDDSTRTPHAPPGGSVLMLVGLAIVHRGGI